MATLPQIKLEGGANVKLEDAHSPASLASDQFMDDVEDDPELSTNEAQKALWMARFPPWLWAALEHANDDEEIDLGTIRIEGSFDNPDRVSLLLNDAPFSKEVEKEYVLKKPTVAADLRRIKRPGGSLMFSEKNRPGYKQKEMYWEEEGPGRSQLYDQLMRAQKKKQRKEEPEEDYKEYVRKPIPKITALAGTFLQEFDCVPVNTEEHRRLAAAREEALQEKKPEASMIVDHNHFQTQYGSNISAAQRQNIQRNAQAKRIAAKENRTTRSDPAQLRTNIFNAFRQHKYWGLRDLRVHLHEPESAVKEVLQEIADMHRAGDFNGKWELKPDYKVDEDLLKAEGQAPEADGVSDVDMEDDDFENV